MIYTIHGRLYFTTITEIKEYSGCVIGLITRLPEDAEAVLISEERNDVMFPSKQPCILLMGRITRFTVTIMALHCDDVYPCVWLPTVWRNVSLEASVKTW
jgi:hypothetical protein